MPTVKIPLLDSNISGQDLKRSLTKHRARGAVIKIGTKYHLVTLDAVDRFLRINRNGPITDIRRTTLTGARITGDWAHIRVGSRFKSLLPAPMYQCPCSERETSSKPGRCTCGKPLTRVDDGG
jgi:hypothetical protein